ncbi:hypothetical protein Trihar35433_7790 [Trichoderma harzianum]|nr:hypothetical protein Trihar35433_7790 [Trichoderma harzianum]
MSQSHQTANIRWGIIGTGHISTLFVKDLVVAQSHSSTPVRHIIEAVATSSLNKGLKFLETTETTLQNPKIYTKQEDLFADGQIDIVYVGLPHSMHKDACLNAIASGKHVLCEKPMAINAKEVDEIVALASQEKVFVMEAVWTRFLPIISELRTLIHEEMVIGKVSRMFCDFSCDMGALPSTSRIKDRNLGGGALLDLGIYPLTLSNLILDGQVGEKALKSEISSRMTVVDGVDHSVAIVVSYPSKQCLGILTASLESTTEIDFCRIEGSRGVIILSGPMAAKPTSIRIQRYNNTADEVRDFEHPGNGFYFEANSVASCILAGKLESDVMPLAETRRIAAIMDEIRKTGGVVYPQD